MNRLASQLATQTCLRDSLNQWLTDAGYLDATVTVDDTIVLVDAGSQSVLKRLEIQGDTTLSLELERPFTTPDFEETIASLQSDMKASGHFFGSIQVESVRRDGIDITPTVILRRGPVARLGQLWISGLKRTDPDLVMRHLSARTGDTVTTCLLERIRHRLRGLDFVQPRYSLTLTPLPGYTSVDLVAHLRERKAFDFEGMFGYVPNSDDGLLWSMRLQIINMFGGGRGIALHSSRSSSASKELLVRYHQPLFLLGVGKLVLSVSTRDFPGQFYDFTTSSSYSVGFDNRFVLGAWLGWKTVTTEDARPAYSGWSVGLDMGRDTRNDQFNPSSGYRLGWKAEYVHRRYKPDSTNVEFGSVANDTRVQVCGEWIAGLARWWIMSLSGDYRGLHTKEDLPPLAELFLIGGPGSLRGYSNERFPAIHAGLLSLESRWQVAGGYVMAFYDGGYLNNRVISPQGGIVTEEDYRYGYGLGLRLIQGDGAITITLGWQPELSLDQPRLAIELRSEI